MIANDPGRIDALFAATGVVPVLTVRSLEDAVPLTRTLVEAGLPILEVTLRTPVALAAIRVMREVPGAVVGAGTIVGEADLMSAREAGAAFAIAPGASDALYAAALRCDLPFLPGIATASEVMRGMDRGWTRFKFFPAEASGSIAALKAFSGPFPRVRFCPTGGIDASKAAAYLALANVFAVGGSWMVPEERLAARDWAGIAALARTLRTT